MPESSPSWTSDLRQRLSTLTLAPAREAEIIEELSLHLDDRYRELLAEGLDPADARARALADLREPELLARYMRPLRQSAASPPLVPGAVTRDWFGDLWRDLRYAGRVLRKQPGFTAAAVLTLALGIGANTAVFSVVQHVLLAPLPYADPDGVAVIWSKWRNFEKTWVSPAEAEDYRTRTTSFTDVGAWSVGQVNLNGGGDPVRLGRAQVTTNLFSVLGVTPLLGRDFTPDDAATAAGGMVILGYPLWQGRYGGDPSIVGQTILLNGNAATVIGVMPPRFRLPTDYVQDAEEPTALWTAVRFDASLRGSHGIHAAGRLKPGVTIAQANTELATLTATLTKEGLYPPTMEFSAFSVSATDEALSSVRQALWLVFGAVGCLLLIACANVANLLLVRAEARTREFAMRSALGADGARLVRQLISEGVWLAAFAGALGVAAAVGALQVLRAGGLSGIPRAADVTIDLPVLAFSVGLSAVTLLLFSLAPALRTMRVDLTAPLKDGAQNATASGGRLRLRNTLVVAETALAAVLLIGAGLLMRSLYELQRIDLGFDPSDTLTMRLALPAASYETPEKVIGFYQRLLDDVRATPGVQVAGLIRLLPLAAPIGDWGLTVDGYTPPPGLNAPGDWQVASDGAIDALGERILSGRDLTPADGIEGQDVALINEEMARRYWEGRDPIGGRFRMGSADASPMITVVGVVANVTHNGITAEIKPKFYRPVGQFHRSSGSPPRNMTLVIRTAGDPLALARPIRDRIRAIDSELPVAAVRTMDDVVATSVATPRLTGRVLGLFAGLALLLAGIGIYGVLAFVVNLRRQEIGIRLAIGAGPTQVRRQVLSSGVRLTVAGITAGLALAALVTPLLAPLLHEVDPLDPLTFIVVALVLLAVALLSATIPAWRASRVDPLSALRT